MCTEKAAWQADVYAGPMQVDGYGMVTGWVTERGPSSEDFRHVSWDWPYRYVYDQTAPACGNELTCRLLPLPPHWCAGACGSNPLLRFGPSC